MNNESNNSSNINNQVSNNNQVLGQNVGTNINNIVNPATQQFVQPNEVLQNNMFNQQMTNNQQYNIQTINNQQDINYIPEKLKKYRRILHNDSITLLVISIVAMIAGLLFAGASGSDSAIDLFMKSLLYFIFLIIIVENKKEIKKFVGVLVIIVSSFMILFAISNPSLFDIVYFILGIIYIIHSIIYLSNFKGYKPVKEVKQNTKIDKLKYVSLALIILCPIVPIISIFLSLTSTEGFMVVFILALASLIIDTILIIKKRKSILVYVCFVFSILLALVMSIYIPSYINLIKEKISDNRTQNSEEYKLNKVKELENQFRIYTTMLSDYYYLDYPTETSNVIVTKKEYEEAVKKYSQEYYKLDSVFSDNEFKKYSCDGYVILYLDFTYDNLGRVSGQPYINCTGKYKYQTDGFDSSKLK